MTHDFLVHGIGYIVPWIEMAGIIIVVWGSIEAIVNLVRRGIMVLFRSSPPLTFGDIRIALGDKMVLGLEFFLAGDIIQTIVIPTWNSLGILGGIVVIRTVIVFFLRQEMKTKAA